MVLISLNLIICLIKNRTWNEYHKPHMTKKWLKNIVIEHYDIVVDLMILEWGNWNVKADVDLISLSSVAPSIIHCVTVLGINGRKMH